MNSYEQWSRMRLTAINCSLKSIITFTSHNMVKSVLVLPDLRYDCRNFFYSFIAHMVLDWS